ncbi:diguanylate cyclase [Piscinibacter sp. XHJ-5]|uniref:GGDEF domain-containing protein n=1 Tax=Piscinibacter sp. XHJ-5 TaxID=3037797 RepID=UPI002452B00A|nr:diguanylate cyclase [Piscinibacter sp. XHJ-5]
MIAALRRLALLLCLPVALFVGLFASTAARAEDAASAVAHGSLQAALLTPDLPLETVPAARAQTLWEADSTRVQRMLPYRSQGSWIRITPGPLPPQPLLIVEGQIADSVVLVLPDGSRVERSKLRPPERDGSAIALVFPLPATLKPGTALLLHLAHHHRVNVDLSIVAGEPWRAYERTRLIVSAAMYAALVAFAVIAACYWVALRERMFADYTCYLLCLILFMTASAGLLYAAPGGAWIGRLGIHGQWAAATAAIGFAVGFARDFLELPRYAPRLLPLMDRLRAALLAAAIAIALWPWPASRFGMAVVATLLLVNLLMIGLGVRAARAGNRYGWYFLAGWVPLTLATSLRSMQAAGLIDIAANDVYLYALGAVWEALALTLGIADRVLGFRRERDVARKMAEHDMLTGVLSRRAIEMQLRALASEARAGGSGLGVLFLDIDHFKSINDRFGHATGDACLVAVAQRLQAELREGDHLGRWGGEEFVALLPGASLDNAQHTSQRILRRVAADPVEVASGSVSVTVSIGIAVFDPLHDDIDSLLHRADTALYRAKANGRNRVERDLGLVAG